MKAANRLKVAFEENRGPSMGCWCVETLKVRAATDGEQANDSGE